MNRNSKILFHLFNVVCLWLLCTALAVAGPLSTADLNALAQHPKMIDGASFLAPLSTEQGKVEVIVELQPSSQAKALSEQSRLSTQVPQEFSLNAKVLYYNLKDESVKKQLRETVAGTIKTIVESLDPAQVKVTNTFSYSFGFAATVTAEGLQGLLLRPEVISVSENRQLQPHLAQGIPLMKATVPRSVYNGSGISVAIVDSGIDTSHPRLGNGGSPIFNSKVIGGYDTGDSDADPRPNLTTGDSHGTSCAGIVAGDLGTSGDYIGGVAPGAKLYALKISTGDTGSADEAAMIVAWEWVITHQNDDPSHPILIVNTSFGGGRYLSTCDSASPATTQAAANGVAAGITHFVSSGNDGYCNATAWPACISYVNSVGAVYDASFDTYKPCISADSCAPTKTATSQCTGWYATDSSAADLVTSYSNSASFLTLFAPSNVAYTTDISGAGGYTPDDYTTSFGGTSAAAPYASGAAAVLQHAAKVKTGSYLSPAMVKSLLTSTGHTLTDPKVAISKPRIDLSAAIAKIGNGGVAQSSWPLFTAAILSGPKGANSAPRWGAYSMVCCSTSGLTYSVSMGGITRSSYTANCTTDSTWQGYASTTTGTKSFSGTLTSATCGSQSGSFSYSLQAATDYLFQIELKNGEIILVVISAPTASAASAEAATSDVVADFSSRPLAQRQEIRVHNGDATPLLFRKKECLNNNQ